MSSNWSASASSAFGSRASGTDEKRAAEAAFRIHQQREAQMKRAAEMKEAKRLDDAMNFASTDTYPSLGGTVVAAKIAPAKPIISFSKTVATMAAKVKAEEDAVAVAAAAAAAEYSTLNPVMTINRSHFRKAVYQLPEVDYEDMDGELEGYESAPPEEGESEGEFNADLYVTRRRGDKGIW